MLFVLVVWMFSESRLQKCVCCFVCYCVLFYLLCFTFTVFCLDSVIYSFFRQLIFVAFLPVGPCVFTFDESPVRHFVLMPFVYCGALIVAAGWNKSGASWYILEIPTKTK